MICCDQPLEPPKSFIINLIKNQPGRLLGQIVGQWLAAYLFSWLFFWLLGILKIKKRPKFFSQTILIGALIIWFLSALGRIGNS